MIFLSISILAGVLTILAPCVLPLLPVIVGTSDGSKRKVSRQSITVILSLSVSVILFTLLIKATTLFFTIPESFWQWFSGSVLIILGIVTIFPKLWSNIAFIQSIHKVSNKSLGSGYQKKSIYGDIVVGASLGPVFTTCSPTYFFILATVLPASLLTGMIYLFGFTFGMALSLLFVAYLGQKMTQKIVAKEKTIDVVKKGFGILFIIMGLVFITGYDKKLSTLILDSGYGATINLEERLIEQSNKESFLEEKNTDTYSSHQSSSMIPSFLTRSFTSTDWSKYDPSLEDALSGGPSKDGIPAIDNPQFEKVSDFTRSGDIQAIVLKGDREIKVYPYNILTWHEIVNDVVDDIPVAVTFCPLCGSAIVYDRRLSGGVSTFGVSGGLLESNMIMYDRETESLWQQSTGKSLAGFYFGETLKFVEFQLMSMKDVIEKFPNALVLSEKTGHIRAYGSNPYSGYEENEGFFFAPSFEDSRYPSKEIFVAFYLGGTPVAVPWLSLIDGNTYTTKAENSSVVITKEGGELSITSERGEKIPFYFEMWFSWAVQNQDNGIVFDPKF